MNLENKSPIAKVIDMVEYRIQLQLDWLHVDSPEHVVLESIMHLYKEDVIDVKWDKENIWVSMKDGSEIDPQLFFSEEDTENIEFPDSD